MKRILLVGAALLLTSAGPIVGHGAKPGYLELRQTGEETYEVTWKVARKGGLRLGIDPRLPDTCRAVSSPTIRRTRDAFIDRWSVTCAGGLAGRTIGIDGLARTSSATLVRVRHQDGSTQAELLTPPSPSFAVEAAPAALQVAGTYTRLGVEHILFGIDHLLFVLALLMLVEGRRRLVETITAFTLAHSLTLAAATLGLVHVPGAPVEAIIALSIVFVAGEIAHGREGRPGVTARRPWIVAGAFGLLHGLGFAGALSEVGLPAQAVVPALLFFNVGVELGQLLFIAAAELLLLFGRRLLWTPPRWAWRIPTYAIGGLAAFWFIQRVAGFSS